MSCLAGVLDTFEGHGAPITGVSAHHANSGNVDFSHLFLTSSIDWSVKLWSLKENRWPLYSFESNDDYGTTQSPNADSGFFFGTFLRPKLNDNFKETSRKHL